MNNTKIHLNLEIMTSQNLGLNIDQKTTYNIEIKNRLGTASWSFKYISEFKMAIYTIEGFFVFDEIKAIYKLLAYHTHTHQLSVACSITDSRKVEGSFHQMNEWFLDEFMPKVVANGFKANANIFSKDFYTQLAQEDLDENINGLFIQKHFEDYQESYDWVTSQKWE